MDVIGREGIRPFAVKTRTRAQQTAEETREARMAERAVREANREAGVQIAADAAHRRSTRNVGTIRDRVEAAKKRLQGAPAGATLTILDSLSQAERELYLLAEEEGQNRPQVLRMFAPPRSATRAAYLAEEADEVPEPPEESGSLEMSTSADNVQLSGNQDAAKESEADLVVFDSPEELLAKLKGLAEEKPDGV